MSLSIKLGLGALSLSSVAGISYAGVTYFSKNKKEVIIQKTSISSLIDKEYKHILLKTTGEEDRQAWENNWNSYKEDSLKQDTDIFRLVGWKKSNPDNLTSKLKEKCNELINLNVINSNSSTYQNVTKYCARDVTIKDQADKEKLVVINTEASGNKDQAIWSNRLQQKEALKVHFTNLGIVFEGVDEAKIKAGCSGSISKTKKEIKYEDIFNAYKKVCAKQSGEQ